MLKRQITKTDVNLLSNQCVNNFFYYFFQLVVYLSNALKPWTTKHQPVAGRQRVFTPFIQPEEAELLFNYLFNRECSLTLTEIKPHMAQNCSCGWCEMRKKDLLSVWLFVYWLIQRCNGVISPSSNLCMCSSYLFVSTDHLQGSSCLVLIITNT